MAAGNEPPSVSSLFTYCELRRIDSETWAVYTQWTRKLLKRSKRATWSAPKPQKCYRFGELDTAAICMIHLAQQSQTV